MIMIFDELILCCDFVVVYWLVVLFGWDDMFYMYFLVWLLCVDNVVFEEDCFFINFFGLMFDEVCVSDLLVVDL